MNAGLTIRVTRETPEPVEGTAVEVLDGGDLQARYDQLLALVLRMGNWLAGPQALRLAPEVWEAQFESYRENLEQVRRLGDELRPVSLRSRGEMLAGVSLIGEVTELFAA